MDHESRWLGPPSCDIDARSSEQRRSSLVARRDHDHLRHGSGRQSGDVRCAQREWRASALCDRRSLVRLAACPAWIGNPLAAQATRRAMMGRVILFYARYTTLLCASQTESATVSDAGGMHEAAHDIGLRHRAGGGGHDLAQLVIAEAFFPCVRGFTFNPRSLRSKRSPHHRFPPSRQGRENFCPLSLEGRGLG